MARENEALEAIAHAREAALLTQSAVDQLLELAELRERPARLIPLHLSADDPKHTDQAKHPSRSIGIFNPSAITIYLGAGGISARLASGALSCPPGGMVVFPIFAGDVEVGVDLESDPGAFAAGDLWAFLLRFDSVQPTYLGRGV